MTVYLAGPINGSTDTEVNDWRHLATFLLDGNVLDPMVRDYRGAEDANVAAIVEDDLADIRSANAVLANCWKPSYGTAQELVYAWQAGKFIAVVVPDVNVVSPWLRYHSSTVVDSVEAAVEAIKGNA